jgi:flagellin
MQVVNTNMSALIAQNALTKNDRALNTAMEQLSTGKRINSAADDAAGLAVATRMTSQVKGLEVAIRNANDGISMVNTAEGSLEEIENMLQRMRELALQASTGTTDVADRNYMNLEYQNLISEIDRIAENTEWNGRTILNNTANGASGATASSSVSFVVGTKASQTISVDFGNFSNTTSGIMASFEISGVGTGTVTVTGTAGSISAASTSAALSVASTAITAIDTAIAAVSQQRATFGAVSNQLEYAVDNLTNIKTNTEASRSRIQDTDYAKVTAELARTQIIQQAGTAMLAQANQMPQTVLSLLQ